MKVTIPLNFYSVSRLFVDSDLRRMGRKQIRRAVERDLLPEAVGRKREKEVKTVQAAILRLKAWQKEYTALTEDWLTAIGTPDARIIKGKLNRYEEQIDALIDQFHLDVGVFADGYSFDPKARIKVRKDAMPKRDRLTEEGGAPRNPKMFEYRLKRKRAQVRAIHSRIDELKEENGISSDVKTITGNNLIIRELKGQAGRIGQTLHQY